MPASTTPAPRPEMIQIEINTECNLRCGFCPMLHGYRGRPSSHVTAAEFREIFSRDFAHPHMTIFSGFAETLLNDEVWEMIAFEKSRGNPVIVATNGVLLDEERRRRLVESGADRVTVTLDTLDPALWTKMRGTRQLPEVLAHLRAFQEAIEAAGAPTEINVNYVVTRSTARTITDFLETAAELRVPRVCFIKIMRDPGQTGGIFDREFLTWEAYGAIDFAAVAERADALGIAYERSNGALLDERGCPLPHEGVYISASWDLSCCPFLVRFPGGILGNLKEHTFEALYAAQKFSDLRAVFEGGGCLPHCRECSCMFSR